MNENVTNNTPKRRRWIARLLVSALCILLASSLLFVGVVADNIELVAQFSSNYALPMNSPSPKCVYPLSSDVFVTAAGRVLYLNKGSSVVSSFDLMDSVGYDSAKASTSLCYFYDSALECLYVGSLDFTEGFYGVYKILLDGLSFESASVVYFSVATNSNNGFPALFVLDDVYYCVEFLKNGSSSSAKAMSKGYIYQNGNVSQVYSNTSDPFVYGSSDSSSISFFVANGNFCYFYRGANTLRVYNMYTADRIDISIDDTLNGFFYYDSSFYLSGSSNLFVWDIDFVNVKSVGNSVSGYSFFADNGILYAYSAPSNKTVSYTVYSGLPVTEPPPESSDETTAEPPPESSGDTSGPIDVPDGYTKIWRTSFASDGSYSSTVIDALDLSEVTHIRAFFGTYPSSESGIESDDPIPLTIELMNGDLLVDTVQYDFYAFGYSLSWMSDYKFWDYVGDWRVIPLNDVTDIYFADNCPYGSVLISSSLPVSEGGARTCINLTSPDSYFTLHFFGNDLFSVFVYNDDPMGNGRQFDFGVKAYKKFFLGQYGNVITSSWYYPEESTTVTYSSSDVIEKRLYGIVLAGDSSYDTDVNMSKLDDISRDHELLESLAESIYGQYSFDSLAVGGFDAAISASNTILDSSGGSYILNYLFGMWTVHPFASAMIAIVGSLAVIGFIIRKM